MLIKSTNKQSKHTITNRHSNLPLLILTLLLLLTLPTMSTTLSNEITAAQADYAALRDIKGHFADGDFNPDVDKFGGKKQLAMEKLGEYLGAPGTPGGRVLQVMGKPDAVVPKTDPSQEGPEALQGGAGVLQGMPGPVIPGGGAAPNGGNYYLVYYWRGKHDYLWFEIDSSSGDEVVKGYSWYKALE
ncbi:hypothetical protein HK097_009721 [Rhizophlyctis rosea]|uniref:Uncharacterized protein n=1 Tax=Rhizophlyctis rosea TaxID=64517 RepID=A0AAD5X3L0_9FUNG|nr:hypothetical protein HK097_009721 [Rhizophlyctis rosea]